MAQADDEFLFLRDDEQEIETQYDGFWDVLIVDDDSEIHSVTQLALSGVVFWNKPLRFHHAYSGAEAIKVLSENPEISVVLLDVVMETDDAGLIAVKRIRNELNNHRLRIILRTGQPGYAPEESITREYDINDYKTKTELTRSKLVTCVIAAIRSYEQLTSLEQQNEGFTNVISASKAIVGVTQLESFCDKVVAQFNLLLGGAGAGVIVSFENEQMKVLGGSHSYKKYAAMGIEQIDNSRIIGKVQLCLRTKEHQIDEHDSCFWVETERSQLAVYVETTQTINESQIKLIGIYLTNIGIAYQNVTLFNKLQNAAFIDQLTGLANRTCFIEKIASYYDQTENSFDLYVLDIADFASINNGLGQDVGNLLLQDVVKRLKEDIPKIELLARIGADVFALLVERSSMTPEVLNGVLSIPFRAGEHQLPINFHFGICEQQYFHRSGKETLKNIYIALNLGKKHTAYNYDYYLPEMEEKMVWQLGILKQLRQDFTDNKLQVWYQPQIDLTTEKVIGAEALLRWPTQQGGFISPVVFVPLAEQAGLIGQIGEWVLAQACEQQRILIDGGYNLRLAVNVSVKQFRNPQFVEQVAATVARFQLQPNQIELEITESVVMDDPDGVVSALLELRRIGFELAIDDFGTGFSSLSYLQKLPLNRIKIDRAFIKDIPQSNSAIAELIVALGKKLKLKTIAEGIENQAQADYLKEIGCDEAQGFMYAKPMPPSEFIQFVAQQK